MLTTLKYFLIYSFAIGALLCLLAWMFQEKLIFLPSKLPASFIFEFSVPHEEVFVEASDGVKLHGILFRSATMAPDLDQHKPSRLLFYLHGNAGSVNDWGRIVDYYRDLPYDLFIPDYRGFGKSEGRITNEPQFYDDILRFYDSMISEFGFDEGGIYVIGYSIGTAPAAMLGASRSPGGIILKAPFFNLEDMRRRYYRFMPAFLMRYQFPIDEFLENTESPIAIMHGDSDEIIPLQSALSLKPLLSEGDEFHILAGQTHNGMNRNPEYHGILRRLLQTWDPAVRIDPEYQ